MKNLFLVAGLLLVASLAQATNYNAASCSQADVISAMSNISADGDTVTVPAGTCTWSTASTITGACQNWTLQSVGTQNSQGANTSGATITVNVGASNNAIQMSSCSGKSIRITGFTWTRQSTASEGMFHFSGGTGLSFRFDHNTFNETGGWGRMLWDNSPCTSPGCVIDHNIVTDVGTEIAGEVSADASLTYPGTATSCGSADNCAGFTQWNQTGWKPDNGKGVYFENNAFTFDNFFTNDMLDCVNGGSYVFRYNTVVGNLIFNHGYDSVNGCLEVSAYQNNINGAFSGTNEAQFGVLWRGGTGVAYSNQIQNCTQSPCLGVTNYRSNNSGTNSTPPGCAPSNISAGKCIFCGGSNTGDQNSGPDGYRCFQQPGAGPGTNASNGGSTTFSNPIYEWLNYTGAICTSLPCSGSQVVVNVYNNNGGGSDFTAAEIAANRDYYDGLSSAGTGVAGVGIGVLASRPATCTTGVGYWATDTITLYQCGAGNAWSTYYTPFTYPHPLNTGAGPPTPTSPTGATMLVRNTELPSTRR